MKRDKTQEDIQRWKRSKVTHDSSSDNRYVQTAKQLQTYMKEETARGHQGKAISQRTEEQRTNFHKQNSVHTMQGLIAKLNGHLTNYKTLSSDSEKNACAASIATMFQDIYSNGQGALIGALRKAKVETNVETIKDYRATLTHGTNNRMRNIDVTPKTAREQIIANAKVIFDKIGPKKEVEVERKAEDILSKAAKESEKAQQYPSHTYNQWQTQGYNPHGGYETQQTNQRYVMYTDQQTGYPYYYDTVTGQTSWATEYNTAVQQQPTQQYSYTQYNPVVQQQPTVSTVKTQVQQTTTNSEVYDPLNLLSAPNVKQQDQRKKVVVPNRVRVNIAPDPLDPLAASSRQTVHGNHTARVVEQKLEPKTQGFSFQIK